MLAKANLNEEKKNCRKKRKDITPQTPLKRLLPVMISYARTLFAEKGSKLWQDVFPSHQACFAPVSRMNTEFRLDDS